ncbi:nicotinic acid mononucleotide adenyltransferase [Gramella jeungdoensis]|uniref:Nicotinic acid mononucleotide adenyltransferase n=1 Tax=Gramella jeungdoensis TaxID=708091 RepID=A0ABT0Z144_9FLAO|nr:nicotinic acid mononucleotide adenyltransferase [Gramella jeungdoensis]MCM8569433.1 nicotinic acid mononucleotide adenyltransferase [Gramella jeungdoensis]
MLLAALFVAGGAAMAQNKDPKPVFEKQDDLIKGTFYYEDGNIRQEGTYKNGKLHGQWISYDQNGEKTAIAHYNKGEKEGKWFFWNGDRLTEVDYENSRIASVNKWKTEFH